MFKKKYCNMSFLMFLFLLLPITLASCTILNSVSDNTENVLGNENANNSQNQTPTPTPTAVQTPLESPEPTANPPQEPTRIVYSGFAQHNRANQRVVRAFNEQSDTVNVEYIEFAPYGQAQIRLEAAIASGDTSFDVFDINALWVREMVRHGVLEHLDRFVARDTEIISGMQHALLEAGNQPDLTERSINFPGNSFFAIPKAFSIGVLAMREDVNVSAPQSWNHLIGESINFQEDGGAFGHVGSLGHFEETLRHIFEFIYGHGGWVTDANGNIDIVNQGAINGLERLREVITAGGMPRNNTTNTANFSGENAADIFFSGDSAFLRADSDIWSRGNFSGSYGHVRFSIAPLPFENAPDNSTIMNGFLTAISVNSEYKGAAWEFIEFMVSPTGQRAFASTSGLIPAHIPSIMSREVLQSSPHFGLDAFRNLAVSAQVGLDSPRFRDEMQIIQIQFVQFLQGAQTARETLENIQQLVDNL